jgi:hypothetical protein
VIESEFKATEGTKAIGFSHSGFGFVVQTLDNATGKHLLSPEIIEDEFAMFAH